MGGESSAELCVTGYGKSNMKSQALQGSENTQ